MCLNPKYVYNKYISRYILVDCGKCEACLQKKANSRSARIRNNLKDGEICLFVTLTYENHFVPFIDTRNIILDSANDLPVYRMSYGRYSRISSDYDFKFVRKDSLHTIGLVSDVYVSRSDFWHKNDARLVPLRGMPSYCVGVCWYPDIIRFIKRLRITLQRKYNYEKKFTYFSCSEYGGKTQRPHFHLLFFISAEAQSIFSRAIVESWPYADSNRTAEFIQVARDCASYVSSYVNCSSYLSEVLTKTDFRQKHSYSKSFGLAVSEFSLISLLEKADNGDMSYCCESSVQGKLCVSVLPIPKYVINRYFPYFKGCRRLAISSLVSLLQNPLGTSNLLGYDSFRSIPEVHLIKYTNEDWYKLRICLYNSYLRFHALTGLDVFDYALYYVKVWSVSWCTNMRLLHAEVESLDDYRDFYEEIQISPGVSDETYSYFHNSYFGAFGLSSVCRKISDMRHRQVTSYRLSEMYRRKTKQKNISHFCLAEQGYNV